MWKSWNPFRRKLKEDVDLSAKKVEVSCGKENAADSGAPRGGLGLQVQVSDRANASSPGHNGRHRDRRSSNQERDLNNSSFNENGHEINNSLSHNDQFSQSGSSVIRRQSLRSRTGMGLHNQLNMSLPITSRQRSSGIHRPITSSPAPHMEDIKPNLPRNSNFSEKPENSSFSGVHGPLLSTPIVPKVRRALESSAGLRSPQSSLLSRGKPVGRSASLNYGSRNPARSTAGQVPWVRLKRKESVGLSDIVSGNTPRSPNTVKLAAPEPRHLPAAPSFKTTPLIVTTEASRARIVDTQTVVSALREKRKRLGAGQIEDPLCDDSWINAAKRRRQDSSQSNASSVSIPPMPESLPNLMATPGASLLHIENLSDQRPSTVPAMDTFLTHHQRELGLGGDRIIDKSQQQVYQHQQQHQQQRSSGDVNNSKSVRRAIQSSLTSSLKARTNMSTLQQGGVDLNRIRQRSQSQDMARRMSFSSDVSMHENSLEEPQLQSQHILPVPSATTAQSTASLSTTTTTTTTITAAETSTSTSRGTVSTPTKRKIAEGVVLRKHNLSIGATSSPIRPMKVPATGTLVSASDFERDKQKEYQRRVLDILEGEDSTEKTVPTSSVATTAPAASTAPVQVTSSSSLLSQASSSAATSAAVSASLDSLNRLVQSATAPTSASTSLTPVTSASAANTLSQLLKSDEVSTTGQVTLSGPPVTSSLSSSLGVTLTGKPLSSPSSAQSGPEKVVSFASSASSAPAVSVVPGTATASSGAPSTASGFNFSSPSSTSAATQSAIITTPASGFHINFGAPAVSNFQPGAVASTTPSSGFQLSTTGSTGVPISSTAIAASSGPASSSGFIFGRQTAQPSSSGSLTSSISSTTASGTAIAPGLQTTGMTSGFSFQSGLQTTQLSTPGSGMGIAVQSSSTPQQPAQFLGQPTAHIPASQPSVIGTQTAAPSFNVFSTSSSQLSAPQPGSFSFPSTSSQQTPIGTGFSFPGQTTSAVPTAPVQGFSFSPTITTSSTAAATSTSTSMAAGFNFPASGQTSTLPSGFTFSSAQPAFGTGSGSSTSAPSSVTATTIATPSFNFGAVSSATSTSSSAPGGFNFGLTATKPSSGSAVGAVGAMTPAFTPGSIAFTSQPSGSGFGSFGAVTQTTSGSSGFAASGQMPQSVFGATVTTTSASGQPLLSSGSNPFGRSAQQPAGTSPAPPPAYSLFGATTTTASTGTFTFGQTTTSSTAGKPFTFGVASTQSGNANLFGPPATTSGSIFAGIASTAPGATTFGSSSAQPFGSSAAPSPFGSSVPTTTQPTFGSPTTTTPLAFGSGAASNQTASVFGAATGPSTNQPFVFGGAATNKPQPALQQAPAFGSNPSSVFGTGAAVQGTSIFGAKPAAPVFGSTQAAPSPVFGTPNQTSTTTAVSAFGSSFSSPGFGSPSTPQQKPAFGVGGPSGFGTPATPAFGSTPQPSVFGSTPQANPQANPPAFGSQPSANPTANPNPFGGVNTGGVSVFGAGTQNPFGATTTAQGGFNFSSGQPTNSFGAQSSNPATTGFNFGQAGAQPTAPSTGAFNFSAQAAARPTFQSPAPGGFNFAAAASAGPTFNFSATPSASHTFTPPTPGSAVRPRSTARRPARRTGPRK